MPHKHRHDNWWDRTAPQPDTEFDALHGGQELLPIEQAAYEAEGAERFERYHRLPEFTTPRNHQP